MSHEIIKNISVKDKVKEIWITSCSNNVHPRTPYKWLCESLTEMYKTQGLEAVEREILKNFYNGNFQGGTTLYNNISRLYKADIAYTKLIEHRQDRKKYIAVTKCKEFIKRTTVRRAFLTDYEAQAKKFDSLSAAIIKMRFPTIELLSL